MIQSNTRNGPFGCAHIYERIWHWDLKSSKVNYQTRVLPPMNRYDAAIAASAWQAHVPEVTRLPEASSRTCSGRHPRMRALAVALRRKSTAVTRFHHSTHLQGRPQLLGETQHPVPSAPMYRREINRPLTMRPQCTNQERKGMAIPGRGVQGSEPLPRRPGSQDGCRAWIRRTQTA